MSVPEKLKLMNALWEDLSATPDQVELPSWHREELEKTKARRKLGLEEPMTLEEARSRLLLVRHKKKRESGEAVVAQPKFH